MPRALNVDEVGEAFMQTFKQVTILYNYLAFVLNFHNCYKTFHWKTSSVTFYEKLPQTLICPSLLKFHVLFMLLISFSYNEATTFLHKYSCLCFNSSVFHCNFCHLLYSWKNPIVQKIKIIISYIIILKGRLNGRLGFNRVEHCSVLLWFNLSSSLAHKLKFEKASYKHARLLGYGDPHWSALALLTDIRLS
jgi:hypothetical protein